MLRDQRPAFEATQLPLTRWFLAMQLLTQAKNNVSALELTRQLGVSYRAAWLITHKLLQGMALAESERQRTGRVEVDDARLGGERSGGKAARVTWPACRRGPSPRRR